MCRWGGVPREFPWPNCSDFCGVQHTTHEWSDFYHTEPVCTLCKLPHPHHRDDKQQQPHTPPATPAVFDVILKLRFSFSMQQSSFLCQHPIISLVVMHHSRYDLYFSFLLARTPLLKTRRTRTTASLNACCVVLPVNKWMITDQEHVHSRDTWEVRGYIAGFEQPPPGQKCICNYRYISTLNNWSQLTSPRHKQYL